jgi:hypothetical protein
VRDTMTSTATAYSNSQLQSYKNCPLQYRFYWDLKLRQLDDESRDHHLRYGAAVHAGLEAIYRSQSLREAQDAFLAAYPKQLDASDLAKTRQNGISMLAAYVKRWGVEDRVWRVVAIEERSDDPWSVKPDLVVEHREHGGLWLVDHKTTGKYLNYDYWSRFEPNSQITHYLDYAQSKYGPVEGFVINAISLRYRQRASKDGPAGAWWNFERQTFNRRVEQIEYERQSRASWIDDIERSRAVGFWRTNTDSCWRCQYRPICKAGWTWDDKAEWQSQDDRELIRIQYYQACDALLENDQHCALVLSHNGPCSPMREVQSVEFEVEV